MKINIKKEYSAMGFATRLVSESISFSFKATKGTYRFKVSKKDSKRAKDLK